jgi:hypothetical protein
MKEVHGFHKSHLTLPSGDYFLRIAPAAARNTINTTMSNMPPPFAGHFDGRGDAAVRYRTHRLMEEVRGFHKSH